MNINSAIYKYPYFLSLFYKQKLNSIYPTHNYELSISIYYNKSDLSEKRVLELIYLGS